MLVEEIELELGADRVIQEDLVSGVLDVLLLEVDLELLQPFAEIHRAGSLEGDVVHAAVMLVLDERALGEARPDVDDRVVAVVEPATPELEVGAIAGLEPEHIAVEFLDRRQVLFRAADIEMQKAFEFHGVPPRRVWPNA